MLRPRIKEVHSPFALPGARIIVGLAQYGIASELQDDEDGTIERLLVLLDGTRDLDGICAELRTTHPDVDPASVHEVVDELIAAGFVEDGGAALPAGITEREAIRYQAPRNYYAWIDATPRSSPFDIQARLKGSSVAVLGLGGTGSAVVAGLVASGVGAVHVADFDAVDESNLCRQLLYSEQDVGASKVKRAVERLRAMNSLVTVTGEELRATSADDLDGLMTGRDAFVLCADQPDPDIMRWTSEAALRTRVPWFVSLYTGPMAVVGGYAPGVTGCWECLDRQESQHDLRVGHRRLLAERRGNAVVAASANISGHLCALEVIYHLGGLPTQVRGRILHWNFAHWDHHYFIDIPKYADCRACGEQPS
jgi:molybdopterin/thiamine biosynthesis adenylyltransferase